MLTKRVIVRRQELTDIPSMIGWAVIVVSACGFKRHTYHQYVTQSMAESVANQLALNIGAQYQRGV